MAPTADSEFRRGLAGCLAEIGAILFAIALELASSAFGYPCGSVFAFFGLLAAVGGAVSAAMGVGQMGRAAKPSDK